MPRTTAYGQLAEQLVADVVAGRYPLGARLPTEAELCASSGLSRGTVRQALQQLERLGMISRRPGDGSRVLATGPVEDYQPVAASSDDIMALVQRTRIARPEVREVVLGRALAARLGARAGSRWHVIEGVRVHRERPDVPLCWSEQYVRSGPAGAELVLRGQFSPAEAAAAATEQVVSAEELPPELATRLGTSSRVALVVLRRHRDARDRLVSVGVHTHPGDRYTIRTTLGPTAV